MRTGLALLTLLLFAVVSPQPPAAALQEDAATSDAQAGNAQSAQEKVNKLVTFGSHGKSYREHLETFGPDDRDTIPLLERQTRTVTARPRRAAFAALARIGEPAVAVVARLSRQLRDAPGRQLAVNTLGVIRKKPELAIPALLRSLRDKDAAVSAASGTALLRFQPLKPKVVQAIAKTAQTATPPQQRSALRVLAQLGTAAVSTAPTLIEMIETQSHETGRYAATALGRMGPLPPSVLSALLEASRSENEDTQRNAVVALAATGSNQEIVDRLLELVSEAPPSVQLSALNALNTEPFPKRLTPVLLQTVSSPDRRVRELARQVLRAVEPELAQAQLGRAFDPVAARLEENAELQVGKGDWPQLGGSRSRNNTPSGLQLPNAWDVDLGTNIKWTARLGSQTFGNPVIANGRIFLGTNNGAGYLKRFPPTVDLGCLVCFRESDGKFLWQFSSEKLPTGRVNDWPLQGICSSPIVDGQRMWFVTNRGEVVCLDTEGFSDGEDDGPVRATWQRAFLTVARLTDRPVPRRAMSQTVSRLFIAQGALPGNHPAPTSSGWAFEEKYRAKLMDDRLVLYTESKRVAEFGTNVLEGLDDNRVSDVLRTQFAVIDAALPKTVRIETVEAGKEWIVFGSDGDEERPRARLVHSEDNLLECFRRVDPANTPNEADVVWRFDMMKELGVFQHNMATCAPTIWKDLLFICTSNGVDNGHVKLPAPEAPSFIAMDKHTGDVVWTDNSPGENVLHGQWSCPAIGVFDGVPQVIFPGGDGWVYSFHAERHDGQKPELLWKFDANPKRSKWTLGGRGTRNNIISVPVVYDGLVYIAVGQDPEHGEGKGHLYCLDPTRRGDVSADLVTDSDGTLVPPRRIQAAHDNDQVSANPNSAVLWHFDEFDLNQDNRIEFEEEMHRAIGSPVIKDDLLFIADFSGLFHCINAKTGVPHWSVDLLSPCWATPLIAGETVYVGDEDGDVAMFPLAADPGDSVKDGVPTKEINVNNAVYCMPVVANDVLYVVNRSHLIAIVPSANE